jgi:hypothetical protein
VLLAGLASAAGAGATTGFSWDERMVGYEMIAPWWEDPATGEALDFPSVGSFSGAPGVESVTVFAASPEVAVRLTDYRLEASRAEPPQDGWHLPAGQSGPFATAPATVDDVAIQATLRFYTAPTVEWAELALTAVGPDGRRYLVTTTGPVQTEFYGSVWSWFAALAVEPGR